MSDYLMKAILKLRPNSQFTYSNRDFSTIKWDVLEGKAPTQAQIDLAIEQVKADEIIETEAKVSAKSELLAKLGITEDEAKLLLS
jgi:hypothetical protein